jgi:hypothetical protein
MADPISYIFGGNTGLTYEELKRRRAIADAVAVQKRPFPKTFGEGLTALGEGIGEGVNNYRLSAMEAEGKAKGKAEVERLLGGGDGPVVLAPDVAPAPDAPAPAPAAAPVADAGEVPPIVPARRQAIGGIESGGAKDPYRAVGVPTKYGRALGRYGVVEANVAPWTAAALGKPMTPQEFLANDAAQDAVFDHRFGQYAAKHGEEGAARAWFAGERGMNNLAATDAHKRLSVADYGKDYLKRLDPRAGITAALQQRQAPPPVGPVVTSDEGPVAPPTGPVQVASLTPPGASPAPALPSAGPPPMMGPAGVPENPITPTDIPARPPQFAQLPGMGGAPPPGAVAGAFPGSPSAAAAPPPAPPPAAAPPPVAPPEPEYEYPAAKPRPRPPNLTPAGPEELNARRLMLTADRPEVKAAAQAVAEDFAAKRKFQDQRAIEQYKLEDQHWMQVETGREKWKAEREMNRLKLQEQRDKVTAGKTQKLGETERMIGFDPETATWKDITPDPKGAVPGSAPRVKLSETQAKTFDNLQKAEIAFEQYKRVPGADEVLSKGLIDELAGRVPFFNNKLLSSRYARARNAALHIVTAHLRETSGAVIAPSEEASHIAMLFPKYGDDASLMKNKAQVREGVVTGMRMKLGTASTLADYATGERKKKDDVEQAKIAEEMRTGLKGREPVVGRVYVDKDESGKVKSRRYWTGSRWEDD